MLKSHRSKIASSTQTEVVGKYSNTIITDEGLDQYDSTKGLTWHCKKKIHPMHVVINEDIVSYLILASFMRLIRSPAV